MSQPDPKAELHEAVEEFLEGTGEPQDAYLLHEEIDKPNQRTWLYDSFREWINEKYY